MGQLALPTHDVTLNDSFTDSFKTGGHKLYKRTKGSQLSPEQRLESAQKKHENLKERFLKKWTDIDLENYVEYWARNVIYEGEEGPCGLYTYPALVDLFEAYKKGNYKLKERAVFIGKDKALSYVA